MERTKIRALLLTLSAAALAIGCGMALRAAHADTMTSPQQGDTAKKVWTNEDLRALESTPLAFESESVEAAKRDPFPKSTQPSRSAQLPRQRDPAWYRVQLAELHAQLGEIEGREWQIRAELDSRHGGTKGLNLAEDSEGVTPESALQGLRQRRAAVLKEIDAIEDLARRNGIPPGELRREPNARDYSFSDYIQSVLDRPDAERAPVREEEWRARFAELRRKLDHARRELDVLQQELGRAYVQYYPDPSKTLKESLTYGDVNRLRTQIAEKKAEIASLDEQVSDLEDDLRHAGLPAGWAR